MLIRLLSVEVIDDSSSVLAASSRSSWRRLSASSSTAAASLPHYPLANVETFPLILVQRCELVKLHEITNIESDKQLQPQYGTQLHRQQFASFAICYLLLHVYTFLYQRRTTGFRSAATHFDVLRSNTLT